MTIRSTIHVTLVAFALHGCGRNDVKKDEDEKRRLELQVEAEKQKVEAEKLKAALEKEKAELEKQKRELAEAELRMAKELMAVEMKRGLIGWKHAAGDLAYTAEEHRLIREDVEKGADTLGRFLLGGTHPTGLYGRTGIPLTSLSLDRKRIIITVNVEWKGGITGADYQTTYSMAFNKSEGLEYLKVLNDSAVIQIDAQYLRATEASLKDALRTAK